MKTQTILGSLAAGLFIAFQSFAAPVNINEADAVTLAESLNGVGPVISEQIVSHREQNGSFSSPEELMNVNGIGQVTFENNKDDILVED
ncbi:MAG: hypothetical protein MAG794_00242 [Gammaproteobacteria bacterium]|nr:hypothetical protein [Gammaproteobacteria bacterium]